MLLVYGVLALVACMQHAYTTTASSHSSPDAPVQQQAEQS